ncbi:HTH_Tnp_Tc3_2 domain-containing protein [Trichonephila clavipes]|nr:HTH_Tnp_Tc3_2 domain-containing protein [Trichonephila clavipes]
MDQWTTILFTYESHFGLNTDSRHTFIWKEPGTRYLPYNVREIDHCGGGDLMVWASILLDGRTPLHVFKIGCACLSKQRVTQNHFYLKVADITIWRSVFVTLRAVDFEAGDWRGNCTGHFYVGKEEREVKG